MSDLHQNKIGTLIVHGGHKPDPINGAVVPPIVLASTFAQPSPGLVQGCEDPNSFGKGFEYSRTGNPTRGSFERALAVCEQAQYCVAFSSGMAATSAVMHMFGAGDRVLCIDNLYGGTQRLFRDVCGARDGIQFATVSSMEDATLIHEAIIKSETPREADAAGRGEGVSTRLVWAETPTNPLLKLVNIKAAAEAAHSVGALLCVDNTFMSPFFQNPLTLGADLVIHSVTKYISGHSDVVMGAVVTNSVHIYEKLRKIQNGLGGIPSPFDCYMAIRGLRTLHVRLERSAQNAMHVATHLEAHPMVQDVMYPGLASHPQHALAKEQMQRGFGGVVSFRLKCRDDNVAVPRGGVDNVLCGAVTTSSTTRCSNSVLDDVRVWLKSLQLWTLAESLGAVESLAEAPSIMTHASVPPQQREEMGLTDSLIRLSVGIEDIEDLLHDIDQAFDAVRNNCETK